MKNISVQKESGWCVPHTLTNALRDENFLQFVGNEKYKACGPNETNHMLELCGYKELQVYPIIDLRFENLPSIPLDFIYKILASDFINTDRIIPFFLSIAYNLERTHYVSLFKYKNKFYYSDPVNKTYERLHGLGELQNRYLIVKGLDILTFKETEQMALFDMQGDNLELLKL